MCIQQPQDSSQRSAVIAHYNQSSWARLSSPFGIKKKKKKGKKHKTKPQSSADTSPAVCPTQTSARGAKWKEGALPQGFYVEDYKAQGQDTAVGEGTRVRHGTHATAQPAPTGWAVAVWDLCPSHSLSTWTQQLLTAHWRWCKLLGKSPPHHAGLPTPPAGALPAPGFTSPSPEARAEPEQGEATSKDGK